jgi:polysaccharide export outer membrane protein
MVACRLPLNRIFIRRNAVPIRLAALALTLLMAILSPAPGRAQVAEPSPSPAAEPIAETGEEGRPLVQLGPGDTVTLSVFGQPEMNTTDFVADDGTITVPLAGPVIVRGLSPTEAARRIEQALRDKKILVDPHVTISAVVSRSQRVSVLGEVNKPGRYVIESNVAILDLLAEAGGVKETGSDTIYLLRPDKDGKTIRYPINLAGLSNGRQPPDTPAIQAADQILVPRAEQFYIYGEVATPGKFKVEPGMTVIEAIARAGGITVRGSQRRVEIKRLLPNGSYQTTKATLGELVKADDVIRVKESIF